MDFRIFRFSQKFSDLILNTVNIWHFEPHPPIVLIRVWGVGNFGVQALSTDFKYEK